MGGQIQGSEDEAGCRRGRNQNASQPLKHKRETPAVIDPRPKAGHEVRGSIYLGACRPILQQEFIEMAIGFRHPLSLPNFFQTAA
jgi:hypothetical protein